MRNFRSGAATAAWLCGVGLASASLAVSSAHRTLGDVVISLAYLVFTTMGALLVVRVPRHPIGPLFVASGLCAAGQELAEAIVADAQRRQDLAGFVVHAAAWLGSWMWMPAIVVPLVFVTLLFPDGRPVSPRWRWAVGAGVVGVTAAAGAFAVAALTMSTRELVGNNPPLDPWQKVAFVIGAVGLLLSLVCALLGIVSIVIRYRRGDETTRQQSKVVLFATCLAVVAVVLGSVIQDSQNFLEPFGTALIALAVAVAVLRYRLFDIDRLISRTLSYVIVTGVLLGCYIGVVALVTRLLPFSSSVGVAASTLFVAAAFNPVRRKVQAGVDRRFNRARYDAARTVEAFAARLRDQVDADVVHRDLLAVTGQAMQPSAISLWTAQ
jgi:hypothetical protein